MGNFVADSAEQVEQPHGFVPDEPTAYPVKFKSSDPYASLAGGSEAKISNPPNFLKKLLSEFAAPYLEAGQAAWEGRPQSTGEKLIGDLRVLSAPFTAIQRQGAETAQSLGAKPQAAEAIGDLGSFAAGLVPPVRTVQGIISATQRQAARAAATREAAQLAAEQAATRQAGVAAQTQELRKVIPAIETPEVVARREQINAIESQLSEAENLRQSLRGGKLLRADLQQQAEIPHGFVPDEAATVAPRSTIERPAIPKAAPVIERPSYPERVAAAQEKTPSQLEKIFSKPLGRTPKQAVNAAADEHIRALLDTPAALEFKGKTYEGAVREGKNIRLKDAPDRVVKGSNQILQVEEKIPFDVPEEMASGEKIESAAVHASGQTFTGQLHSDAIQKAKAAGAIKETKRGFVDNEGTDLYGSAWADLFVTNKGRVIDRLTADREFGISGAEYITKQKPAFQQTPAGKQAVIPGAEGRSIPNAPLKPKRAQTEKPMELEQPGISAKEPGLFEKPIPSKNLSAEETAAANEMRGMLGTLKSERGAVDLPGFATDEGVSGKRLIAGGLFEESSKTLSKTMGDEGAELARLAKAIRNDAEIEAGIAYNRVGNALKSLDENQLDNLVDVREGVAKPMDEQVSAAEKVAREELDKVAARAKQVKLQIRNPITGEKTPFEARENYFPHMFGKELGEYVKDPRSKALIKEQIKEQLGEGATDVQVEKALQGMIRASRSRNAHLEIARVFDAPDYSRDPKAVLSKHFSDAYRRINIAEKYGPDLEKGESLLTAIGQNKGDKAESFARSYFQRVTGTEPAGNQVVKQGVDFATNFQAFSKLGQAVISNLSQPTYTAVVTGAKNAAKGYRDAFTQEGRDFAEKTGGILNDTMSDFLKDAGARTDQTKMGRAADATLKYTGFTYAERLNRTMAANSGKHFARETFDKLIKNPQHKGLRETLAKMNVDVDEALKRGALNEADELRAGQSIINRTQFKTDVTEIPLFWSSEPGRLLTQFKKFQFKSGQMVKEEILKEMGKGNVAPFLRAAALLPVAGYGVLTARDAIRFGSQREKDPGLADYLATVGTFGAFTDAFAGSGRQPVRGLSYLAGPTLGDAGALWEAGTAITREADATPMAKLLARQIPVIGPSVRQLFNSPPKSERAKMLEELGIERPKHSKEKAKLLKELGIQ